MAQDNFEEEPQDLLGGDSDTEGASDELGQSLLGDLGEPTTLEPEPESQQIEGINVDLTSLSDEQLAEMATDNPAAIRAQASMQSAHTKRSQEQAERESQFRTREEALAAREANLTKLLNGQQQSATTPGQQGQQLPEQRPQGVTARRSVGEATNLSELGQILTENILADVDQRLQGQATSFSQRQQEVEAEQFRRQVADDFEDLAADYPETKDPPVYQQIQDVMVAHSEAKKGYITPRQAYVGVVLEPTIAKRRKAVLTQKAKTRAEKGPTTKPTKSQTAGKPRKMSREEITASVHAHAEAHPSEWAEATEKIK